MDVGHVRKRLLAAIDASRREAAARRLRAEAASRAYDEFLERTATPVFRDMAIALRAHGLPFEVMTPSGGLRLVSTRNRDDAIELELDTTRDPPTPMVSVTRVRGSRSLRTERPVKPDTSIEQLGDEDVLAMLLEELKPWLA
jgi:hypothetical protein